tara:strand:- start:101 stop:1159 length:1059 start_codon:yes stop_codon:yes gene_type:complete
MIRSNEKIENAFIKPAKVICIGEALIDRLGPLGGSLGAEQEQSFQDCLGGAPANVACALSKLGVDAAFIGRLGNDWIGEKFRQVLIENQVNISGLQEDKYRPSRIVLVERNLQGDRSFGGFEGDKGNGFADQAIAIKEVSDHWSLLSREAKWIVLGTIPFASNSSSEAVFWILEKALSSGIRIAADVNWRPTFWNSQASPDQAPDSVASAAIRPLLEISSLIKLAKEEALYFFGMDDPTKISRSLPQNPDVVVTNGSKPVKWLLGQFSGEMEVLEPPLVVDTTGAGDAFTAGLISKILVNDLAEYTRLNAEGIIRFASACGALVCTKAGAILPQPQAKEVQAFIDSNFGDTI